MCWGGKERDHHILTCSGNDIGNALTGVTLAACSKEVIAGEKQTLVCCLRALNVSGSR